MFRVALALPLTASGFLFGQIQGGKRINVAFWAKTNLQQFGGRNVDIVICGRNMGAVEFAIVDNDHVVVSAVTKNDSHSPSEGHAVFSPVTVRKSISLTQGIAVPGTQAEAHLLYEIAGGPSVYFLDALDTRQNECALLVVGKPTQQNSSPIGTPAQERKAP